jgi:large subunit ribosomal protein L25
MLEKQEIRLEAQSRTHEGKKVRQLREQGIVPAVVYGHGKTSHNVQIKLRDLDRVYKNAGENTLVDLVIDNESPIRVLIHDVSHDVITDYIQHVDFYAVNMHEKIHAAVVLHFVVIAPAVKEAGGTLVKTKDVRAR